MQGSEHLTTDTMEDNDYERLEGVGVVGSMTAGALAGTAEHLVMYPVDSVKVNRLMNR